MKKNSVLKPQDLLVALKVIVNRDRPFTFLQLADELHMSASEVHAASQRAESSRLLVREDGRLVAIRTSLHEFVLHGVKYAFPALTGTIVRGVATAAGAPPLKELFAIGDGLPYVWPDASGNERGPSLQPLYPSVPSASRVDRPLYEILSLIDALRVGAAREREAAESELVKRL